jgi:hypothetical protein
VNTRVIDLRSRFLAFKWLLTRFLYLTQRRRSPEGERERWNKDIRLLFKYMKTSDR